MSSGIGLRADPSPLTSLRGSPCPEGWRESGRAVGFWVRQAPTGSIRRVTSTEGATRAEVQTGVLANSKPSSNQPVMPPAMTFTGRPSRASRNAPRAAPLQCGPAQ